jgi:hypothetical protein
MDSSPLRSACDVGLLVLLVRSCFIAMLQTGSENEKIRSSLADYFSCPCPEAFRFQSKAFPVMYQPKSTRISSLGGSGLQMIFS